MNDFESERRSERRARNKVERRQAQFLGDLAAILATDGGRRVFARLLMQTRPFASVFSDNPLEMARREGERMVGETWRRYCAVADPEQYLRVEAEIQRQFEQKQKVTTDDAEDDADG